MNNVYDYVKENFTNISIVQDNKDNITNIYGDINNDICFCIAGPHKGNGYVYLLRLNEKATFDRWSDCDIEEEYASSRDLITALTAPRCIDIINFYKEIMEG